jgi:dihydroorotate dehydrogenase (NAD+) catalytic subunit
MKLRGIDFGQAIVASGSQGFFGEGYWFHRWLRPFGLRYGDATFTAKSMTVDPYQGNLLLGEDGITPKEWFPDCIKAYWRQAMVLNAVKLTNLGAEALFAARRWQTRKEPFLLSLALVGATPKERLVELQRFSSLFEGYKPELSKGVGLELDWSCPSTSAATPKLFETNQLLEIAGRLGVPLVVKVNATMPVREAIKIAEHQACDAIAVSNAIPFGKLRDWIDWEGLFDDGVSPLEKYGGGGLSGAPLLPIVLDWVYRARSAGLRKPIIAGGGVLSCRDADELIKVGASAISLGSVSLLRPHRVARIIRHVNRVLANGLYRY